MAKELTISQVAEKVGLGAKTIRYYELSEVIQPLPRQDNTYRRFSERDVERLMLITERAEASPFLLEAAR